MTKAEHASAVELESWLLAQIADYLRRPVAEIERTTPLSDYGMDSIFALSLVADLEDHLDREIDSGTLWRDATVASIVETLSSEEGADR